MTEPGKEELSMGQQRVLASEAVVRAAEVWYDQGMTGIATGKLRAAIQEHRRLIAVDRTGKA